MMAISAGDLNGHSVQPEGHASVAFLMLDGLRRPQPDNPHEVALCVLGLGGDGKPVPLALRVAAREDEHAWRSLLAHLRARGIGREALLVVCDDHPALLKAVQAVYPELPLQVSVAHRLLALARKVDAASRASCLAEASAIFASPDLNTAVARFRAWRAAWIKLGNRAVASLESDLASCLTFYRFPSQLWAKIRTVNVVERAFRESRRAAPSMSGDAAEQVPMDEPLVSRTIPVPAPEELHQVVFGTAPVGAEPASDIVTVDTEEVDSIMNAEMPAPHEPEPTVEVPDKAARDEGYPIGLDARYDKYAVIAALAGGVRVGDGEDAPSEGISSETAMVGVHRGAAAEGDHAHAVTPVTNLSQDADFMWWLQARRRARTRFVRMTVAAATILIGFGTGIALTRVM